MSGKKGMPRYSEATKEQLRQEYQSGRSVKSLSEQYGISRYTIQSWCGLRPEVNLRHQVPFTRGRGKTDRVQALEREVKRLEMENELMRDFLRECGRR